MRALVQRVTEARVEVNGQVVGEIGLGLLVLIGIHRADSARDADLLLERVLGLRLFADVQGRFQYSLREVGGGLLLVSQFTLYGDTSRGRRPSFDEAAPASQAQGLFEYFVENARERHQPVATGIFRASMKVFSVNDGPVTIWCDTVRDRNFDSQT